MKNPHLFNPVRYAPASTPEKPVVWDLVDVEPPRLCPRCGRLNVLLVEHVFEIEKDGSPSDETEYVYLECFGKITGCGTRWNTEHDYQSEVSASQNGGEKK